VEIIKLTSATGNDTLGLRADAALEIHGAVAVVAGELAGEVAMRLVCPPLLQVTVCVRLGVGTLCGCPGGIFGAVAS